VPRALLLFEPPDGGAPEVVLQLALALADHGWEVLVAGPEHAAIRARLAGGCDYQPLRHLQRSMRAPWNDLRALRALERLLAREPVDVIHCHSSKAGVLGRLAGRRRGIPVVYSPHCFAFLRDVGPLARLLPGAVERALAPLTSAYVCVCESEHRAALAHRLAGPERVHRIYNGVPAPTPTPPTPPTPTPTRVAAPVSAPTTHTSTPTAQIQPEQALLDFKGEGLLVGAVAVLRPQKRLDVLIDAIPAVLEQVPQARVAIVGNGPLQAQLQAQAAALGLHKEARFKLFPFAPPSGRYMSALDLYVLPSAWEALPMGVLEALAWGVPQVVSSVGGTTEAVTAQTGRLVRPKHPASLAEAIVELLQCPQALAAARDASRARHCELFDARRMAQETAAVYRSVLAARAGAPAAAVPQPGREERAVVSVKLPA
jgi:glycosyltransferase involved in cell wall biosynthesis